MSLSPGSCLQFEVEEDEDSLNLEFDSLVLPGILFRLMGGVKYDENISNKPKDKHNI